MKFHALSFIVIAAGVLAGCEVEERRPAAAIEVDAGAPVVYDTYYDRGYYDGPYFVWVDHDGHRYRERREFHERRISERAHPAEHRVVEHHEAEHHDDHR